MAQVIKSVSFKPPFYDQIADPTSGLITRSWQLYFRLLQNLLNPFGSEISFGLENEQLAPANITGLSVDSTQVSQAIVDYIIQRVTTGTNPVELLESGTFHLVYKPTSQIWVIYPYGTPGPESSGVTLSVTTGGQVQYVSTLVDGTPSISKICFRIKTLSAKNNQYSGLG